MLYHVPTPPSFANLGDSFRAARRFSSHSRRSGSSTATTPGDADCIRPGWSNSTTPWIESRRESCNKTKKRIELSFRGRIALQRSSIRRCLAAGGIAAPLHPLHRTREIGRLVTCDDTSRPTVCMLEELTLSNSHAVRLYDIEGRMLSVDTKTFQASPYVSSIQAANEDVQVDSSFFVKLLCNGHGHNAAIEDTHFPYWQKYTTAVMLYIALAEAGFCDQSLPFLSIQWINWQKLLKEQLHLRLDLMLNQNICRAACLPEGRSKHSSIKGDTERFNCDGSDKCTPVAVLFPVATKGTLRRPISPSSNLPPSLSTRPFSDAEIFQLFYLQLLFRAVYDIRFSGMMVNDAFLRSDLIAVQSSGRQSLAFQYPEIPDRWLLFPSQSNILCFISLEMAVIPHFASASTLKETEKQRLFGASSTLPCIGDLGRAVVVDWAMKKTFHSPQEAMILLGELFNLFDTAYGVKRLTVWRSAVAPRLCRCGESAFARLRKYSNDLSGFMTTGPLFPRSCSEMLFCAPLVPTFSSPALVPPASESVAVPSEDSVVKTWRKYMKDGDLNLFFRSTDDIEIKELLGRGGSALVYKGTYGSERHNVAVKCFVIPDGMSHELYLKECLTSIAFGVLFNQLERFGIACGAFVYDCVVSCTPPRGMTEDDVRICCRGADPAITPLCYVASKLMDGTLGRFLTEKEDDYDPCFDVLLNSPLSDGEFFQFLYTQLVLRALFDYTVFDLMLSGQLRGDNIGYETVHSDDNRICRGLIVVFKKDEDESVQYLRFPVEPSDSGARSLFRSISIIDMGQGMQPSVEELSQRGFIGETIPDSCIQDDGLGRYWPRENVYAKYIEANGAVATAAARWGAGLCINSPDDAECALRELFELYKPTYGISPPTAKELEEHFVLAWTPERVAALRDAYIYRKED